jgi:hypothetical protein
MMRFLFLMTFTSTSSSTILSYIFIRPLFPTKLSGLGRTTALCINTSLANVAFQMLNQKVPSNAALLTLISKLISFIRSTAPAHNKLHIVTLYPFHFLKLYPPSNISLQEGRAGTAWEPSKPDIFYPPSLNVVSLPTPAQLSLLFISPSLIQRANATIVTSTPDDRDRYGSEMSDTNKASVYIVAVKASNHI